MDYILPKRFGGTTSRSVASLRSSEDYLGTQLFGEKMPCHLWKNDSYRSLNVVTLGQEPSSTPRLARRRSASLVSCASFGQDQKRKLRSKSLKPMSMQSLNSSLLTEAI